MPKICMLHIHHSPLDDRVFYKETLSLVKAGFEVITLCAANAQGNVMDMGNTQILNPNKATEFDIEGVKIYAVPHQNLGVQQLLNKIFQSRFFKQIIQKGIDLNADVYHCHEPESYYIALQIQKKTGAKVVFDAHESWQGEGKKADFIRERYLKELRYLIAANPMTKGHLMTLNRNIEAEVIYNFPTPNDFNLPFDAQKFEQPIIVHDGYLPFNRGLREMVEAIYLLKSDFPNVQFRIVGATKGEERAYLTEKIAEYGLQNNITETGWLPYHTVPQYLADCAIGLICKTPTPNNILGGPAIKLFNYFASGLAVVDFNLPESTYFLNQAQAGISVQQRSIQKLYEALKLLLSNKVLLQRYCRNAFEAYENKFNWLSEEKKLIDFYKNVVLNQTGLHIR